MNISEYLPVTTQSSRPGSLRRSSSFGSNPRTTSSGNKSFSCLLTLLAGTTAVILLILVVPWLSGMDKVSNSTPKLIDTLSKQFMDKFTSTQLQKNVTNLQVKLSKSRQDVSRLNKQLQDIQKHENELQDSINTLQQQLRGFPLSYDNSNVGYSVYENMENYYRKGQSFRWVLPCAWPGCRTNTLPNVLEHLIEELSSNQKTKLAVVQLGTPFSYVFYSNI